MIDLVGESAKRLAVVGPSVHAEVAYYGEIREYVGRKRERREVPPPGTVQALVEDVAREAGFDESAVGRADLIVLVDGTNVRQLGGLDTRLSDGATVSLSGQPMAE